MPIRVAIARAVLALGAAVAIAACGSGATSTPGPTPTPPPAPGAVTLDAFADLIARDDLGYRYVHVGSVAVDGGPETPYRYEAAVRGADFRSTLSTARLELEIVTIGEVSQVRTNGGPWVQGPRDAAAAADILDPWRYLGELADLAYQGDAPTHPGGALYRATAPIPYAAAPFGGGAGQAGDGTITNLYLVLDDATGAPIVIELNAEATTTGANGAPDGVARTKATLTFSDVGAPVDIEPPQ